MERTGNTAGPTWVCRPGQRPVSRAVLSGAPRTFLRRTAGTPPRPHERRTRFPPGKHSNSSVMFLHWPYPHPCLSAEASRVSLGGWRRLVLAQGIGQEHVPVAQHPAHDPAPSVISGPPAVRARVEPWPQGERRQSVALAPMRDAPRAVMGASRTSAARPRVHSRS
jgi:hypothetical protein